MSLKERDFKVTYEEEDYFVRLCIIDDEYEVVTVSDKNKDPIDLDADDREEVVDLGIEAAEQEGWKEEVAEEEESEEEETA